jgi:hypothetical protein
MVVSASLNHHHRLRSTTIIGFAQPPSSAPLNHHHRLRSTTIIGFAQPPSSASLNHHHRLRSTTIIGFAQPPSSAPLNHHHRLRSNFLEKLDFFNAHSPGVKNEYSIQIFIIHSVVDSLSDRLRQREYH